MHKVSLEVDRAYVLARRCDALEKLEIVISFHAAFLDPLAQGVKRRQVTRIRCVEDRHHNLHQSTATTERNSFIK